MFPVLIHELEQAQHYIYIRILYYQRWCNVAYDP